MITRIVKLTVADAHIEAFRATFSNNHSRIEGFPGCIEVKLVTDIHHPNTHFTISTWHTETDLENYRQSEIFQEIWSTVKPWFSGKPEAWSTEQW
jgi:quinol monooxygenase YgiN